MVGEGSNRRENAQTFPLLTGYSTSKVPVVNRGNLPQQTRYVFHFCLFLFNFFRAEKFSVCFSFLQVEGVVGERRMDVEQVRGAGLIKPGRIVSAPWTLAMSGEQTGVFLPRRALTALVPRANWCG